MGLSVAVIRLFRLSGENIQKNWMTNDTGGGC